MDPLSVVASTIAIVQALSKTYEIIKKTAGLPGAFEEVSQQLPIVDHTLRNARSRLRRGPDPTDEEEAVIIAILKPCQEKLEKLKQIFEKLQEKCQHDGGPTIWKKMQGTYHRVLAGAKANRVETLMEDILKSIKMLALNQVFKLAMAQDLTDIDNSINKIASVEPSLPDSEFEGSGTINAQQTVASGAHGQQNNVQGGENTFNSGMYIATGTGHTFHYGEPPKG
ncbi:hypothetical protein ABW21_db0207830 [Orbilia brochopaga]|nr:hypothetical protein ABW21_db0207830 [Drechslerella brochopaga]